MKAGPTHHFEAVSGYQAFIVKRTGRRQADWLAGTGVLLWLLAFTGTRFPAGQLLCTPYTCGHLVAALQRVCCDHGHLQPPRNVAEVLERARQLCRNSLRVGHVPLTATCLSAEASMCACTVTEAQCCNGTVLPGEVWQAMTRCCSGAGAHQRQERAHWMEKSFTRLMGHSYTRVHLAERRRSCSCCSSLAHLLHW